MADIYHDVQATTVGGLQLNLKEAATPDEVPPYGVLKQIANFHDPYMPFGLVICEIQAFDEGIAVTQADMTHDWQAHWTWEVRTTDNELRNQATRPWQVHAACSSGITLLRVTTPEGKLLTQNREHYLFLTGYPAGTATTGSVWVLARRFSVWYGRFPLWAA